MWEQLAEIVEGILKVYRKLLQLGKNKRTVLVTVQIKELERIVHEEQALINIIARLEEERLKVSKALAQKFQPEKPPEKLEHLLLLCKSDCADTLKRLHEELKIVIAEIDKCNELNTNLTKQALVAVDYKINVLSNSSVGPTYAEKGQEQVTRDKRLDFKA